ncbi:hypothetical protein WH299_03060 [Pseudomonas sp. MYb541]|uniref:DUF6124 family protein n=1 Tax=Pseudomonas sp. MYb541 TaxID=2745402 RepID=UPI0030B19F75
MIKDNPNPPSDATAPHNAAHRAINHYLNPLEKPRLPVGDHGLFTVREGIDIETLLVNASEDLESAQALASHLAFEIDGAPRSVALGVCRILDGIQLLVAKIMDHKEIAVRK